MNDIKRLKIPYDVPPSMHYSKIKYWRSFLFFVAIFSLVFNVHLYQHLFLSSFILNHTSRLSSCKSFLFLGCIFRFPTWWDFPIYFFFFGPNFCLDRPFGFSAQQASFFFWPYLLPRLFFWVFSLVGFFFFFFFFFGPQLLPRLPFWVFSLAGFFSFLGL